MLSITVKNYRCFSQEHPLLLELRHGFTAFVGPNNAGKSTALRFLFEMRALFQQLQDLNYLQSLFRSEGPRLGASLPEPPASDSSALFSDGNDGPLEITLALSDSNSWLRLSIARAARLVAFSFHLPSLGHREPRDALNMQGTSLRLGDRVVVDLRGYLDAFAEVAGALYFPAFRHALAMQRTAGTYYDIEVGQHLIEQWGILKNGPNRANALRAMSLTEDLRRLFGFKSLEINAATDGQTLRVTVDNRPFPLAEIGAGFAQFFVTLMNVALKQPSFILIDEPELNLHPTLQLEFLTTLAKHATCGVMFATHSLGLARSSAERIYSVQKIDGGSIVKPFEAATSLAEFLGEMSYAGSCELGYRNVVLVEGSSEVKALQQLLRVVGKDRSVVLLSLGGSDTIKAHAAAELAEVRRLVEGANGRVSALIDSERDAPSTPLSAERAAFEQTCKDVGVQCHVLEKRAFENYLPADAPQESVRQEP